MRSRWRGAEAPVASNVSHNVGRVYAMALVQLGAEKRLMGRIHEDLHAIHDYIAADHGFRMFFSSPRIERTAKWAVVRKALHGQACDPVLGLMKLLILRGREPYFDNVVAAFDKYRDVAENRIHAYVETAVPLEPAMRDSLRRRLETASSRTVELHEHVDPALLGGASIRVGDRRIDRTLRRRLQALRERIESSHTETSHR